MAVTDRNNREIQQAWLFSKDIKKIKQLAKDRKLSIAEMIEKMLKDYKEG